ncbi:MAG: capsule assembly Wzi family protein [Saprospiraceae bacterium]|nr:capsule assembly Wzi family protein [Saprospiraceae bacterium]
MKNLFLCLMVVGIPTVYVPAQFNHFFPDTSFLTIQTGLVGSFRGDLPYWLSAGNNARIAGPNLFLRLASTDTVFEQNDYALSYGLDAIYRFSGPVERFDLTQSYLQLSKGRMLARLGKKRYATEFFSGFSMPFGGLLYSNNSQPVPTITVATNDWIRLPVPYLGRRIFFQFDWREGWLGRNGDLRRVFLHGKSLSGRLTVRKKKPSLYFYTTLSHSAQWHWEKDNSFSRLAKDYTAVFFGGSGDATKPVGERINALGNHLGTFEFSFSLHTRSDHHFLVSAHFLWDDGSGMNISNWDDGMYTLGLHFKRNHHRKTGKYLAVSYLRTTDQDAFKLRGDTLRYEPNNYFNNGIYRQGWTYQGRIIGTPFFLPTSGANGRTIRIANMAEALSIIFSLSAETVQSTIGLITHQNSGQHRTPFLSFENKSLFFSFGKKLRPVELRMMVSHDWWSSVEEEKGKNTGMALSIIKNLGSSGI